MCRRFHEALRAIPELRDAAHFFVAAAKGEKAFSKFLVPAGSSKLHPILKPRMLKRNKKVQQTIDHNDVNKNNALIAVTFENDAALAKVFRKIIKYNRTHDNILLVFFEKFVN